MRERGRERGRVGGGGGVRKGVDDFRREFMVVES